MARRHAPGGHWLDAYRGEAATAVNVVLHPSTATAIARFLRRRALITEKEQDQ